MALESSEAAYFGQAGVMIHTYLQIGVTDPRRLEFELVCETKHTRITAQVLRREIEITVRGHTRDAGCRHRAKVADEPAQAHEVALIQRHQADEAAWPRSPSCHTPLIG